MSKLISALLSDSRKINTALWVLFSILLVAYKLYFHELWKDEWQAWLVARDMSLGQMLGFLNYEGHPALWYLYLKLWTVFPGNQELLLQLAHSTLLIGSLYYLFVKIKLPSLWKLLIFLSYFIVYEYSVINRGYIWVILLTLIAIDLISRDRKSWSLGLSLFLLCQTEAYGVIIAAALSLYLLIGENGKSLEISRVKSLIQWPVAGFILFLITVYPRGNTEEFSRAYNQEGVSFELVQESLQCHLANVFAIGAIEDTATSGISTLGVALSLLILGLLVFVFMRDRRSGWSFGFGMFGFILFGVLIFTGGVRQWGLVYLLFAGMLVLSHLANEKWSVARTAIVTALMILPLMHGVRGILLDAQLPFSNAKEAGLFIKDKVPVNVPVVAINKFETAVAGAYAERAFYELPSGETFTYFKWLEQVYIPTQSELDLFCEFKKVGGLVLISPQPIDQDRFPRAQLWESFDSRSFKRENFWIYTVTLEQ